MHRFTLRLLPAVALSRHAIQGGSAELGHGAHIVDRQMIRVPGGQDLERADQSFVMRGDQRDGHPMIG